VLCWGRSLQPSCLSVGHELAVAMGSPCRYANGCCSANTRRLRGCCEIVANINRLWPNPLAGHTWRTSADIVDTWDRLMHNVDNVIGLARFAGPGGWNDPGK
jgi:hypothetical protein